MLLLICAMEASPVYAAERAFLRVVHAAVESGPVDVLVDGESVQAKMGFGMVSGYVSLTSGVHRFQVVQGGKSVLAVLFVVSAQVPYTLALLDAGAGRLTLQAFIDNNELMSAGAKIRVYQLSAAAGSVGVRIGDTRVLSNLKYQNSSEYLTLSAGVYHLAFSLARGRKQIVVKVGLEKEMVRSLFVLGRLKRLRFVQVAIVGLPGPPMTGSDPSAEATLACWHSWVRLFLLSGLLWLGFAGWRNISCLSSWRRRPTEKLFQQEAPHELST